MVSVNDARHDAWQAGQTTYTLRPRLCGAGIVGAWQFGQGVSIIVVIRVTLVRRHKIGDGCGLDFRERGVYFYFYSRIMRVHETHIRPADNKLPAIVRQDARLDHAVK